MIPLTYEKYAISSLHPGEAKPASELFLPDQLIEAMRDVMPRIDAFDADYRADVAAGAPELLADIFDPSIGREQTRVIIPAPRLSWTDSVAMTSATIHAIRPAFGRQFDQMIAGGWSDFTHTTVPGMCGGYCWKGLEGEPIAGITLQTDGTISDPVDLTHEAGHYVALTTRGDHPDGRRTPLSNVVAEGQAFFFQFARYDEGLGKILRSDIAEALEQHRRAEMLYSLTASIFFIRHLDDYCADLHSPYSEQGKKDQLGAELAHSAPHGYGALLGAALYGRYQNMSVAEKDQLLDVLYPGFESFPENDGKPTLGAVLAAVGIETAPQLASFFHEGADLALSPPVRSATPKFAVESVTQPEHDGDGWFTPSVKMLLKIGLLTASMLALKGDLQGGKQTRPDSRAIASWLPSMLAGRALETPIEPPAINGVPQEDIVQEQWGSLKSFFNDQTDYIKLGQGASGENDAVTIRDRDWGKLELVRNLPTELDQVRAITQWAATAIRYDEGEAEGFHTAVTIPADTLTYGTAICSGYAALIAKTAKEKSSIPERNISLLALDITDKITGEHVDGHMVALFDLDGEIVVADGAVVDSKGNGIGMVDSLDRYLLRASKALNANVEPIAVFSMDGNEKKSFGPLDKKYVPDLTPLPSFSAGNDSVVKQIDASAIDAANQPKQSYQQRYPAQKTSGPGGRL